MANCRIGSINHAVHDGIKVVEDKTGTSLTLLVLTVFPALISPFCPWFSVANRFSLKVRSEPLLCVVSGHSPRFVVTARRYFSVPVPSRDRRPPSIDSFARDGPPLDDRPLCS